MYQCIFPAIRYASHPYSFVGFRRRKLHVTSLVPPSLDVDPCRAGPTSHDTYKARKRGSHARFPPAPNLFELGRKLRGYYRHLMVERAARARGVAHSVLQREVIRVRGATEGATTGDGSDDIIGSRI
ncbi:hypothetical protein BHE74_00010424 [Ensete ventricosum]|nr:hypothetical protein BHE74_00010424 [Ensete ventricosum]